jgi:hypothetical protein
MRLLKEIPVKTILAMNEMIQAVEDSLLDLPFLAMRTAAPKA